MRCGELIVTAESGVKRAIAPSPGKNAIARLACDFGRKALFS
ncbi:hypothetical protein TRICHSKD4_2785 [Roseibium sp. TrichSKD4]|nr:hypothetical protein TRICHSKD4_2785 [Roseibium sp. TrichSKD4]